MDMPGEPSDLHQEPSELPVEGQVDEDTGRTAASEEEWNDEEILPWSPSDTEINRERITNLTLKLGRSKKRLQSSQFYRTFLEQMEEPELSSSFQKVLGSEPSFQMVIYGLGNIESNGCSRLQLNLALSLQSKFHWIGEIQVFDPVLSATEIQVLESLGCSVLKFNEHGRRKAVKPTLFFMPFCPAEIVDNLIELNWKQRCLDRIALFGNSFELRACSSSQGSSSSRRSRTSFYAKYVVAVSAMTDEFQIAFARRDLSDAFEDFSWHFFPRVGDAEIPVAD